MSSVTYLWKNKNSFVLSSPPLKNTEEQLKIDKVIKELTNVSGVRPSKYTYPAFAILAVVTAIMLLTGALFVIYTPIIGLIVMGVVFVLVLVPLWIAVVLVFNSLNNPVKRS